MDQDVLRQYFTLKEFTTMSAYEKKRHRNIKDNYEKMIEIGLDVPKPIFMNGPFHPKKRKIIESDDSDEEWKPGVDIVTIKKKKISSRFSAPFRTCGQTSKRNESKKRTQRSSTVECSTFSSGKGNSIQSELDSSNTEKDGIVSSRYPKRNEIRSMVCYKESEIPDDDNFIYCEDCGELNEGQCAIHPLSIVNDKPTSKMCKDRAHQSLPDGLSIGPSKIRKAGLGVWTKKTFPKGVQFGPYEGEVVYGDEGYSGYAWQIHKDGKRSHFVDGQKENKSNWMRFVNCARNENEQNLVAFQYQGQIYYRSFKPILTHCELLVFYGQEYAQELKIDGVSGGSRNANMNAKGTSVTCGKCNCSFMTQQLLEKHMKFVHQNWSFLAKAVKKDGCKAALKEHNIEKENLRNESCHQTKNLQEECIDRKSVHCDKSKRNAGKTPYEFEHCGRKFNQSGSLKRHLMMHTGDTPYKCEHCGKKFNQSSSLKTHLMIHTGERPFECEHCGKRFKHSCNLKEHLRIHTGDTPYKCEHCGKKFNQSSSLKTHLMIHTGETPFECEHCGKKFNQSGSLKTHLMIHTGETPFECEHCGKKFNQSNSLKEHLRIHTGEMLECEHCDKKFNHSGNLKRHLMIHTGEKPFECEHCGKKFNQSNSLKEHLRIHTGEMLECEHCDKKFNHSGNLKRHLMMHTGEMPFECEHCGKKFKQSGNLKSHLKTCINNDNSNKVVPVAKIVKEKEE